MERHDLSIGTFTFHEEGYVHAEANEGVEVTSEIAQEIFALAHEFFERPFGFLIDRKHDYSVNFDVYQIMTADVMIRAVAVVARRQRSKIITRAEKTFLKTMDYAVFEDLDEAREWILERVRTPSK